MIIGPISSGWMAPSAITAQPAWQLAMTQGLPWASGCIACTRSMNAASADADIAQRLTGNRLGQEAYEVAGMARLQGVADLAVRLETADTRPMARPRIDNDEGAHQRIDPHPGFRAGKDAEQHIIAGPSEGSSIHHDFIMEGQDRRLSRFGMFDRLIATLAHDVPEQDRALESIREIIEGAAEGVESGKKGWSRVRCPIQRRRLRRLRRTSKSWCRRGGI